MDLWQCIITRIINRDNTLIEIIIRPSCLTACNIYEPHESDDIDSIGAEENSINHIFPRPKKLETSPNPPDRRLELFFFPVVIASTKNWHPARQTTRTFFFSGRNLQPARQTTGTFFFSGRNRQHQKLTTRQTDDWNFFFFRSARQTTGTFLFSCRNNDRAPARQTTGTFFFLLVTKISRLLY